MTKENEAVILSAARTPIGRFQGSLSSVPATQLGAIAVKAAVERAGINPAEIEEVIMGNVVQAGEGQAPARQAGILGGVPATVSASTVNKVCGSGLKAAMFASQAVRAGDADLFVAGGFESMSRVPYLVSGRSGELKLSGKSMRSRAKPWINLPFNPIRRLFRPRKTVDLKLRLFPFKSPAEKERSR